MPNMYSFSEWMWIFHFLFSFGSDFLLRGEKQKLFECLFLCEVSESGHS